LIRNIVQTYFSSWSFCNNESFDVILKCFHHSETSDDAHWIASAISTSSMCRARSRPH
jgi:hypothetical protein